MIYKLLRSKEKFKMNIALIIFALFAISKCEESSVPPGWAQLLLDANKGEFLGFIEWIDFMFGQEAADISYKTLGLSQCSGIDESGHEFFEKYWGEYNFGGNSICNSRCAGTCEAYNSTTNGVPITPYPFLCKCSKDKPLIELDLLFGGTTSQQSSGSNLPESLVKLKCSIDEGCSSLCGHSFNEELEWGTLCTWWNLGNPVNATADPYYPPISWCECRRENLLGVEILI